VTNTQTDTQTTLRVTSAAIGRIYAKHATRPNDIKWSENFDERLYHMSCHYSQ